jgi:hypothetical protein
VITAPNDPPQARNQQDLARRVEAFVHRFPDPLVGQRTPRQQVGTEQAYEEGEDGIPEERYYRGF